jgi:predicted AAA+ superfamily ATPase
MWSRKINFPKDKSSFLFGPRGTGKTTWTRELFPQAARVDLLRGDLFAELTSRPARLEAMVAGAANHGVVIDEVQKVPAVLDEVHRLIEERGWRFVLTGSSARKLRRAGVNLLAGRALTMSMHPLTAVELGTDFDIRRSLRHGHLPAAYSESDPDGFLRAYVSTYLREEVQQEALVRNLPAFARFLETASFSQAAVLNIQKVASDAGVSRKTAASHFELMEDLLLSSRLEVFTRRARRKVVSHPKFFFFDAGVFRALRPRGPLDIDDEIGGIALETLVFQELRATSANLGLGYTLHYWRTAGGDEVDFVLYGERGLIAVEVKHSARWSERDLASLELFHADYPMARCYLLYGGDREYLHDHVRIIPVAAALTALPELL